MTLIAKAVLQITVILAISINAFAATPKILQILHTNDLHSYWEKSSNKKLGGYARIKTLLDQMEAEGDANGWATIRLDAGDFSEGNINFWADTGRTSFEIMKLLNYDAIALGNHDHQLGINELIRHASTEETKLPLVAANFFTDQPVNVKPGKYVRKKGLVIAVGGATTDNPTYTWTARPAEITAPKGPLESWLIANEMVDIHIALTHLGTGQERKLAKESSLIDIIIGGHSHTTIDSPIYEFNKNGKPVPIVQAGARGLFVGRMLVELPVRVYAHVLSYSLKRVTADIPEDPVISAIITEGLTKLQNVFGQYDFNQIIGHADKTYFTHREPVPIIGNFLADALREAVGADIAFDSGRLYGDRVSFGPVNLYNILNLTPHLYSWESKGWKIVTCDIAGSRLSKILSIPAFVKQSMIVSGMTFRMNMLNIVRDLKIHGAPVVGDRIYKFALSEGFVRGLQSYPELDRICRPYTQTGVLVRDAIMKKAMTMKAFTEAEFGPRRITGFTEFDWECNDDCPDESKGL